MRLVLNQDLCAGPTACPADPLDSGAATTTDGDAIPGLLGIRPAAVPGQATAAGVLAQLLIDYLNDVARGQRFPPRRASGGDSSERGIPL
jgi:hypothetical protein